MEGVSDIFALLTTNIRRFRSTDSYKKIGYHFGVSKRTATQVKWRVQGYMLFKVGAGIGGWGNREKLAITKPAQR